MIWRHGPVWLPGPEGLSKGASMFYGLPFHIVMLISTTVDLAVALFVALLPNATQAKAVAGNTPTTLHAGRFLTALFAAGLSLLVKAAILRPEGLTTFGMVHLGFLFLGVTLPTLAMVLLVGSTCLRGPQAPKLSRPAQSLAILSLLGIPICGQAMFVEPFRLQLERATVLLPNSRQGSSPIKIAVLADLQVGHVSSYERSVVDRLLEQQPDIILIPGDFHQMEDDEFELELPALRSLLEKLRAPGGVFFVSGDTDTSEERTPRLLAGTSIQCLDDAVITTQVGDRRLTIGGLALEFESETARRVIAALEQEPDTTDVRILFSHRPDSVLQLPPNSRIDLVVAGHTHGGQIVVPGFGPPITLSHVPRAVAAGGLHHVSGNAIYVSRGAGCERAQAPRIRLFCPPEISLLTLGPNSASSTANSPPVAAGTGTRSS